MASITTPAPRRSCAASTRTSPRACRCKGEKWRSRRCWRWWGRLWCWRRRRSRCCGSGAAPDCRRADNADASIGWASIVDIQMRRRPLLSGIAASLAAPGLLAQPASTRGVPLVGVLITTSLTQGLNAQTVAILRQELSKSGYVDGQTLKLDIQSAGGAPEKLAGLAKDLVAREAAVLCAFGPAAVRAARAATETVPIVALDLETEPVREGWVRTLSRPGTNVTGLFLDLSVLTGKWLELLRAAVPRMRRVAVLWDSSTGTGQLDAMATATASMAMDPHVLRFANATDLDRLLAERRRDGVD